MKLLQHSRLILVIALIACNCRSAISKETVTYKEDSRIGWSIGIGIGIGIGIDFEKLANAIHIAENGHNLNKGEQYGIHSVHYSTEAEARRICIRTIRNKYVEWRASNAKSRPYLEYLSIKYCPVNHKVWLHNVKYIYKNELMRRG